MKIIDLKSAPLIWSTDTVPLKGSVIQFGSPNKQISPYKSTNFIHENDLKDSLTPISDNQVDSTQKSNIDIDICFQLKNQPNKLNLKVFF